MPHSDASRDDLIAALSLRDERLQLAAEAGIIGAWEWDIQTDLVRADAGFAAFYGVDPQQAASGVPVARFIAGIHPDDRDWVGRRIDHTVRHATEFTEEYRLLAPGGGVRWVLARGRCLRDATGQPTRFPGVALDITARKATDHAAEADRLAREFAMSTAGMGWFDHHPAEGRFSWDARMRTLFGISFDEPVDLTTAANLAPAEDAIALRAALRHATDPSGDGRISIEYRIRRADTGAERWLWSQGQGRFEDGRCTRLVGFVQDVTDRKTAELALANSQARLALAVEASGLGIWHSGPDLRDLHWDDQVCALFGLDAPRQVTAAENLAAIHPNDRARVERAIAAAFEPGGSGTYDTVFRAIGIDDGIERCLAARGRVTFNAGAPVSFLGAVRDVTAEKHAEHVLLEQHDILEQRVAERTAALQSTQAALVQSQKMEAVGQLTGGLAHDFNNLLTGISGSLELLQTRLAQGRFQELDRYIVAGQGAAKRAAALTHRLLAFSRLQTLDPKVIDANRLVAGMEELIRRTVGPEIALEVVAAAGLWTTLVDASQLENALLNLCINARDAMPGGGKLTIETGNKWLDDRAAAERDMPPGQYISLCVSDSGAGMPADVIARAFDPFFTTKPIGQGTGLGLSMVYGFARQSGGQARIYSEPGAGSLVCVYLPRHGGVADLPNAPELPGLSASARRGETVLVVDDEPTLRMLVTEMVEELGYAALEAGDGASGLAVLRSAGRIDLLISDVGLPGGMNGRQLADAARVMRPELKVLFITGYAENAVIGHGHLEVGMQVMTKPFALDALAVRIKAIIAG